MKVQSFFFEFKDRYIRQIREDAEEHKQDPEGRYLAICLKEVLNRHPHLCSDLFDIHGSHLRADTENSYLRRSKGAPGRRVDLAILKGEAFAGLVEIKMEDKFHRGQFKAYRTYCQRQNIPFRIIARHWLPEQKRIASHFRDIRFFTPNDLYQRLRESKVAADPVVQIFLDFLRESEMIYQTTIPSGLALLVSRVHLGVSQEARRTKGRITEEVPEALRVVSSNLYSISESIARSVTLRGKSPSFYTDIWFRTEVKKRGLFNSLAKREGKTFLPPDDGYVEIRSLKNLSVQNFTYFYSVLQFGNGVNLELGLQAESNPKKKNTELSYYTWLQGADYDDCRDAWQEDKFKKNQMSRCWHMDSQEVEVEGYVQMLRDSIKAYRARYLNDRSKKKNRKAYEIARRLGEIQFK